MTRARLADPGIRIPVSALLGFAAAMGVGRFVYTPLLPIMVAQAGMTAAQGAVLATANYAGYLLGAGALAVVGRLNNRYSVIGAGLTLVATEVAMLATEQVAVWSVLRLLAGICSAALFVACATAVQTTAVSPRARASAFGGVGLGIALSGFGVLVAAPVLDWRALWLGSAVLTAVLLVPLFTTPHPLWGGLPLHEESVAPPTGRDAPSSTPGEEVVTSRRTGTGGDPGAASARRRRSAWRVLVALYFLEGLGYIIIGTFIVDAVGGHGTAAGPLVWGVVGLTTLAVPAAWMALAGRIGLPAALAWALAAQTVGVAIPGLLPGTGWALVAAVFYGATFIPIAVLAMGIGAELGPPTSAATLTAFYGVGQILGPLVVIPMIGDGYSGAFLLSAAVCGVATLLTVVLCALLRSRDPEPAPV